MFTDKEKELLQYHVKDVKYGQFTPRTIFCVVVMPDGWEIHGVSSCRDLENYDEKMGMRLALKHALSHVAKRVDNLPKIQ